MGDAKGHSALMYAAMQCATNNKPPPARGLCCCGISYCWTRTGGEAARLPLPEARLLLLLGRQRRRDEAVKAAASAIVRGVNPYSDDVSRVGNALLVSAGRSRKYQQLGVRNGDRLVGQARQAVD